MGNNIRENGLVFNINEIMHSYLEGGNAQCYVIPSYQRGYEWGEEDAKVLLEDLKKYCEKKAGYGDKYTFYCLQHITLIKKYDRDGNAYFNVVDGQQRLTTIAIILSYYDNGDLFKGKLKYDVREQTGSFLESQIYTGCYWNGRIEEGAKHKDEFYIRQVADAVKEWDCGVSSEELPREGFKDVLLNDVRFILNVVAGDEYRIFSDINGAKAELDGADLMRAVMITRSSKEKYGGTNSNKEETEQTVSGFRVRMGMELDAVNAWCSQDEIKKYLELLLPNEALKNTIFNPNEYPVNYIYRMMYEVRRGKKEEFGFRYFEYGLDLKDNGYADDNWEMYEQFKRMYNVVRDWYSDKEIFYYTSYLFSNYKIKVTFGNLYNEYTKSETKSKFRKYLHGLVKDVVLEEYKGDAGEKEGIDVLKEHIESVQKSWYEYKGQLIKILILLDVIISLNSKSVGRMQLEDFSQRKNEDVEHIACQTPSEEDRKDEEKWKMYIRELRANLDDKEIKSIINEEQLNKLKSLDDKEYDGIVDFLNSFGLNSVGNLVLLDKSVNRGYKNALFKDKKTEIFRNYFATPEQKKKKITQIRPYTMNVFSMEKDGYWTFADIKRNCEDISRQIDEFFNKQ